MNKMSLKTYQCECGEYFRANQQLTMHLKINARESGHRKVKQKKIKRPERKQKSLVD